ncbi:MAG: hypothetical protein HFI31_17280 [Lachnospiraceae bacterium]|jgi:predicted amidohydrolase|nr:hypothetical protein [Lachnospiraceae bacterium]MCI9135903.1 hypothetical protein [Lachnospiraceae bacterium]
MENSRLKVRFEDELYKNLDKLKSVYDLSVFCYDYLISGVEDQGLFLGEYVFENEEAGNSNPNRKKLKRFSRDIECLLEKRETEGWSFSKCIMAIHKQMGKLKLADYGNDYLNDATIPVFMLFAIDRYVLEKKDRCSEDGPLNRTYCGKSYIYLNIGNNILDDAAEANNFSTIISGPEIRKQLRHLIFFEKNQMPSKVGIPKVKKLCVTEKQEVMQKILQGKKWKIAVIPFGEEHMVNFPVDQGALFHVAYQEKHIENGIGRALNLLDRAIQLKANVIVFPEYVCSQEIQGAIREHLELIYENDPKCLDSLFLVVAGSGWTGDDNNVCNIFSYDGRLLGRQYKYSRFTDLKFEGKELIENLRNPGKETTIVEIDGVGKVLVGICRDISERSYTKMLADTFHPQLLLTPAWSKSIRNGFQEQYRDIASVNHRTCSILCNCCEAIRDRKELVQIGIAVTPFKDGTVVIGKEHMICRSRDCVKECESRGCVCMVCMDFSQKAVRRGEMIGDRQYFCV